MAATSNQQELLHTRLLAKYPGNPMKALWEALIDKPLASCEVAMAIVNDTRCGIERRSAAADEAIWNPALWSYPAIVAAFRAASSDVTLKGGATPLMLAALAGRDDVLEALLSLDAAVDAKEDEYGYTALHIAALVNNPVAIEMLIAKGSDVHAVDKNDSTSIHEAVRNGNREAIKLFISKGSGVNVADKDGWTLLHWAAYNGDSEAIELLIASGGAVVAVTCEGLTPLHWAVRNGNIEAIELLTAEGSDVEAVDADGSTPLHWAASNGTPGTNRLLITNGGDVNAVDDCGSTPLHWAARACNLETIELLIAEGCVLSVVDNDGYTPLMLFRSDTERLDQFGRDYITSIRAKLSE